MITRDELKEYAKRTSLPNLGHAEKDYFQNVVLFVLYQSYGRSIVFKGGTALKKVYGLDRFSDDLDFTCAEKIDVRKLDAGLGRFRMEFEKEVQSYPDGLKVVLRIKGPLYTGIRQSLCRLALDFSFRETVVLEPEIRTIGRFLEEIPSFDVVAMQESEILAEKARAVMTRTKARDVYDMWFLLKKGVKFDATLAEKKLEFYGMKWDPEGFKRRLEIQLTERAWRSEMEPVVSRLPDLGEVRKLVLEGTGIGGNKESKPKVKGIRKKDAMDNDQKRKNLTSRKA